MRGTPLTTVKSSQAPMTLAQFMRTNERIIGANVVENCECGCIGSGVKSCPRQYDLFDVDRSANIVITRDIANQIELTHLEMKRESQIACFDKNSSGLQHLTKSGGYCLKSFLKLSQEQGMDRGDIVLPFPDRPIQIPKGHVPASPSLTGLLFSFINKEGITSLNEFGAGLGQYGADIERRYTKSFIYRGYDGAGDVESYTHGYVQFADLATPLNLPQSDWVLFLQVGEHVPSHLEGMVIRNLHAHNCRGILLSWSPPGQGGLNIVNLHDNEYIIDIFTQLGYVYDIEESNRFRNGLKDNNWLSKSFMILRRKNPVC